MLEAVVGTESAERTLMFLSVRERGYAAEIARMFETDITSIKNQLERMERDGLLIHERVGRTKVYSFNPRFAFLGEVQAMVSKAVSFLPKKLRDDLELDRRRPRRTGKPL